MKKKAESNVSVISASDGPTSFFIAGRQKRSLPQEMRRIIFKIRKVWFEKHITGGSHTMEEVGSYIKDVYGFTEVNQQSKGYQAEYIQMRASFAIQYAPELLEEYVEKLQLDGKAERSLQAGTLGQLYKQACEMHGNKEGERIRRLIEQNEIRQKAAENIPKEVFDIDLHIYRKKFKDTQMDFILELKYGYIGGGVSGSKTAQKQYRKMYRNVYRYYGVTKEDIAHRTKRYENLIRTLAQR